MKRLWAIGLLLLSTTLAGLAQSGSGQLQATSFGQWQLSGYAPSSYTFAPATCFVPSPLGGSFIPFNTNAPVQIVDANPALNEVVTPTSVTASGSTCMINVTPAHQHYSFTLRSGTFGLQEAINAAGGAVSTTVIVTPSFTAAGGVTSTITNAKGSTSVSILDARTATLCSYTWNGSAYAQAACMGSGGGGFTAGGDLSGSSSSQTVIGINGVTLSGLATGLLKIATGTGAPSIAAAGTDYLTPTGSAAGLSKASNAAFGVSECDNTTITCAGGVFTAVGGGSAVSSVFGRMGAVTAQSGDYTVSQITGAAPLASPTLTGTPDASGATQFKLPVATGATTLANGELKYDSTNLNWHAWVNGVDTLLVPLASGFVSGHCGQPTSSGGSWTIVDAGGVCGTSGGGAAFSAITSGTNTTAAMLVGAGGSLNFTSTGTINASTLGGNAIGTSGATIPLLNGVNTFGAINTFSSAPILSAGATLPSGTVIAWNADLGLSRGAGGTLYVGSGAAGSAAGSVAATNLYALSSGNLLSGLTTTGTGLASTLGLYWSNGASFNGTRDTAVCRNAAGVVEASNSTTCNALGSFLAALYTAGTGFAITGATTAGHYLRNNATNYVDSAIQAGDLPLATTVAFGAVKCDGTTITCTAGVIAAVGGGSGATLQTNTVNNSSQTTLNLLNSSTNAAGLTLTLTNTSGGNVQGEIAGTITAAHVAPVTNVAGGALGSVHYQSAANATAFLASPTTSGHTFFLGWTPSGSALAPIAIDLATYLASPPPIGGTSANSGNFTGLVVSGSGIPFATGVTGNNDLAGSITLASGSGSYSFTTTHATSPICIAGDQSATNAVQASATTITLTLTGTGTDVVSYICVGRT